MGRVPATVHSGSKVKLAQMRVKTVKASKTSFKIDLFQRKKKKNFEIFNLFQKMNYKPKKVFMASIVLKLVADVKMMNFVVEIPANA